MCVFVFMTELLVSLVVSAFYYSGSGRLVMFLPPFFFIFFI